MTWLYIGEIFVLAYCQQKQVMSCYVGLHGILYSL